MRDFNMRRLLALTAVIVTVLLVELGDAQIQYAPPDFGNFSSVTTTATTQTFGTTDGTRAVLLPVKALTAGVATAVVLVSVASGASVGGAWEYTVSTTDATPDYQVRHGSINFAAVNKGGTETCTVGGADQTADGSVIAISSGGADTLTYGITCATTPTNGILLLLNAVSSLTETSLNAKSRINIDCSVSGACSVTAQ